MTHFTLDTLMPIVSNYPFWRFYFIAVVLTMVVNAPLSLLFRQLLPSLDAVRIVLLVVVIMPLSLALSGYYFNPFAPPSEPEVVVVPEVKIPPVNPEPPRPMTKAERKVELLRIYREGLAK